MTIIDLNEKSLESEIKNYEKISQKGKWLIRYHADWCGHCINMKDEWKKLENNNLDFNLASIEESVLKKLSKHPSNLLGFPSIHLVNNGKFIKEHSGERKYEEFKSLYHSINVGKGSGKNRSFKNKKNKKKTFKKTQK